MFKIEFECHNTIGDEKFSFYHPIELGDFTINFWEAKSFGQEDTKKKTGNEKGSEGYSLSLYENGSIVVPMRDPRFSGFSWSKLVDGKLTASQLGAVLRDIRNVMRSQQQQPRQRATKKRYSTTSEHLASHRSQHLVAPL